MMSEMWCNAPRCRFYEAELATLTTNLILRLFVQQLEVAVKALTYSGPDGTIVANPSLDFLEDIIFQQRERYWRGGSGDSTLAVVELRGKKEIGIRAGEPALCFWLVQRHGFFFTYFDRSKKHLEQFVPFAGGESSPWVKHMVGGEAMFVPRACFVSRPFAWEIVQEFVRSRQRSPAVPWVKRTSLEFPYPAAGDEPPAKADLA
jgi:hypothetical protein